MTQDELTSILIKSRKNKNLSHEQVAQLTGGLITRQYYGMIEKGERRPSVDVAKAIADVLEIDWTIFFEIKGNHKLQKQVS